MSPRHFGATLAAILTSVAGAMQPSPPAIDPADAAPAASVTRLAWPSRAATVVRELEVGPWRLRWVGDAPLGAAAPEAEAARSVLEHLGDPSRVVRFEGEGAIIVRMPMGELSASARAAGKPAAAYEHVSAAEAADGSLRLERTWFVLYEPKGRAEETGAAGLVVLLPGMFGTPEPVIDSLVGMLRGRGWHVLRMLTHPSRFTEKAGYALVPDGDLGGVAASIASEMNGRVAECALAVDGVCAHIARTREDVPVRRRIALGLSGGGMVLPTVVAHDPDAYIAAVLVGAGCDFAQIAIESNYTDWIDSVRIGWRGEPAAEDRRAFTEAYLRNATFDGYSTAPLIAGIPALMIHGEGDRAVPAAQGDLLWERLGRPERWSEPIGHEALFLAYLPTRASDMLDWIEEHARP